VTGCVMAGSSASVTGPAWRSCPPHPAVGLVALALLLATTPAYGDDCGPGRVCLSEPALRRCDADQATLAQRLVELRVCEQRLVIATGDAEMLSRALDGSSRLVTRLRADVLAATPWLPGWAYVAIGAGLGVLGSVVLALSL